MIRKTHLSLALAGLALAVGSGAQACTTAQWGQGGVSAIAGTPLADGPVSSDGNAALTATYAGKCALSANAAGDFVQDGTPVAEASYLSRFYVLPNNTGEATIFQAMVDAGVDYPIFKITFDQTAGAFKFYGGDGAGGFGAPVAVAAVNGVAIVPNRWYMIETNYQRNAGTNGGTLGVTVLGNRGNANYTLTTPSTAALAAGSMLLASATDGVDFVQFGWITGGAGSLITVDAFESRRSTVIGSLKRGDVNNSGTCTPSDVTQMLQHVNALVANNEPGLKPGQADCNESGTNTAGDVTCILNLVNADTASGGSRVCGI